MTVDQITPAEVEVFGRKLDELDAGLSPKERALSRRLISSAVEQGAEDVAGHMIIYGQPGPETSQSSFSYQTYLLGNLTPRP